MLKNWKLKKCPKHGYLILDLHLLHYKTTSKYTIFKNLLDTLINVALILYLKLLKFLNFNFAS